MKKCMVQSKLKKREGMGELTQNLRMKWVTKKLRKNYQPKRKSISPQYSQEAEQNAYYREVS